MKKIKQFFCDIFKLHRFKLKDIKNKGTHIEWKCYKCGKICKGDYGLQILEKYGEMVKQKHSYI